MFRLALARAGCAPSEAVHVGDSWEADYVGATRAGLRALWLNRHGRAVPAGVESVADLDQVLDRLDGPRAGGPVNRDGSAPRARGARAIR